MTVAPELPLEAPSAPASPYPTVAFRVFGDPAAQGSKKVWVNPATGRAQMREQAGAKLTTWRTQIAAAAEEARAGAAHPLVPLDGPLRLGVTFRFAMPASRPAAARRRGQYPMVVAPDLDKLIRALGDGMKAGGLIRDDARIAFIVAEKIEITEGWLGADVTVGPHIVGATP